MFTIVRAVPSGSIAPLTFKLIVEPLDPAPVDRVAPEVEAAAFEAAAALFAALVTPVLNDCPFGIVPENPPADDPLDAEGVFDLFASAVAPTKTPAAKAVAPTPSNGFKANADATPATIADAFNRL